MTRQSKQPEPINAVATDSGLWNIQNYTRYKTSDLLALLNLVEDCIKPALPPGLGLGRAGGYKNKSGILYIDTFTGGLGTTSRRRWSQPQGPVYVKHTYDNEVRIVAPERLGISDIEQLTYAGAGETPIPAEAVAAIIGEMVNKYNGAISNIHNTSIGQTHWLFEPVIQAVRKEKPVIRYLARPENKKPVQESGDPRLLRLAKDKARVVFYAAQSIIRQLDYLDRYSNTLNNYSKKRGHANYADMREIEEMLRIARKFLRDSEACMKALEQELNEP